MKKQATQQEIIQMFDDIAPTYDIANRAMSFGVDILWRKEACQKAYQKIKSQNLIIADIACGSGDMISHWIDGAKRFNDKTREYFKDILGKKMEQDSIKITKIYAYDSSEKMLSIAKKKLESKTNVTIEFLQGEAKKLPFKDESVDIISIAYGLRNVLEYETALSEFARVLKKDGVLVILEFLKNNQKGIANQVMNFYTRKVLPFIGGIISSNFKAYNYLPNSIGAFISPTQLESLLKKQGITKSFTKSYSAGVSTLFIGVKKSKTPTKRTSKKDKDSTESTAQSKTNTKTQKKPKATTTKKIAQKTTQTKNEVKSTKSIAKKPTDSKIKSTTKTSTKATAKKSTPKPTKKVASPKKTPKSTTSTKA